MGAQDIENNNIYNRIFTKKFIRLFLIIKRKKSTL